MPSFDIVSEVNLHELKNAVDQTTKEISTRYDFKGTDAGCTLKDKLIGLHADSEFQLKQIQDILHQKLGKRNIDVGCLNIAEPVLSGKQAKQDITVRDGIDQDLGRKIVKIIKQTKLKTKPTIQDNQVRVTAKKRDDLQQIIELLSNSKLGLPLQYVNFRD